MKRIITLVSTLALFASLALAQAPANTYVFSTFGAPASLDPARAYDTASGAIIENVYETLFSFADPAIDELQPALATSFEVLNDGLTFRFQLRPDVQFHSGNTMTCADAQWSFRYGMVTAAPEGATS